MGETMVNPDEILEPIVGIFILAVGIYVILMLLQWFPTNLVKTAFSWTIRFIIWGGVVLILYVVIAALIDEV